jgi:hypothetical protein
VSDNNQSIEKTTNKGGQAEQQYHCYDSCNKCGGVNELIKPIYEECGIIETTTKCKDCGFDDFWAYGFFESMQTIECKCQTYSFNH